MKPEPHHALDVRRPASAQVKALFSEAVRLHQTGRIEDAVPLYKRILSLDVNHVNACSNLGVAFISLGRPEEAVRFLERALAIDPRHGGAHTNLAAALSMLGRLDDAAAHYVTSLTIDPDNAEAHNDLANVLHTQGRFQEAMTHYDKAIAINPAYAEAHLNRSEIKTFQPGDPDIAVLEVLAVRKDLPAAKVPYIHFALAKALEDRGDYDRAFEQWHKGNESKRRQTNYHEPAFVRLFERIANVFDRSLLGRSAGQIEPRRASSVVPVFVVGMPRSGSTLIEQILASHPRVHGAGELEELEKLTNSVSNARGERLSYPDFVPHLDSNALHRMGQAYLSRLPSLPEGKSHVVDKLPINFINVGLIRLILPQAKIIHTMRDPIDTCVSCYSRLFSTGQEFSYDLAELGRYYRRYAELMNHWRDVLPAGSMLEVSYEEVVRDLEGQARRLIDYCGVPWDDRCVAFHSNSRPVKTASSAQVRKPIFRTSIERWRRYETHLGPLLQELGDLVPGRAQGTGRASVE